MGSSGDRRSVADTGRAASIRLFAKTGARAWLTGPQPEPVTAGRVSKNGNRWGKAALACVPLLAGSCVPGEVRQAAEARRVIAEAQPLLRRLGVAVPDLTTLPPDTVVTGPVRVIGAAAAPFVAATWTAGDAARALECLTAAVYYEARSDGEDGQRAVAQVVLNRVRDRAFPASVCGVVFQGSNRSTGCQFSFTCDGSMARRREPGAWERARAIAGGALAGSVYTPVGSATHFHTGAVSPWWAPSLARIGMVGSHIFYRWRSALERVLTFRQAYAGYEPGVGGGGAPAAWTGAAVAKVMLDAGEVVTVHRGGGSGQQVAGLAAGVARMKVAAGVRVHANRHAPEGDAQGWSGAYEIDGTTIGEESDPI